MSFPPPGSDSDRPLLPPSKTDSALPTPASAVAPPSPAPWSAGSSNMPPPGYVAYNPNLTATSIRSTAGLRKTTIVLFWVATASSAALTMAMYSRVSVWDNFIDGSAGLLALEDSDNFVVGAFVFRALLMIVAGIVLSIWSYRTVKNAQQFGRAGLKPGLAAGGWYIPLGNLWVPFVRLRRATEAVSGNASRISHWQAGWIVFLVLSTVGNNAFALPAFGDRDEIRSILSDEAGFHLVLTLVHIAAALLGQRALREVDRSIAERQQQQQRDTVGTPT